MSRSMFSIVIIVVILVLVVCWLQFRGEQEESSLSPAREITLPMEEHVETKPYTRPALAESRPATLSPPTSQPITATTSFGLKFVFLPDSNPVSGVRAYLLKTAPGRLRVSRASPAMASDVEGGITFTKLEPGFYRWQLLSSHDLVLNPPFEQEAVVPIKNGYSVQKIPEGLSGAFEVLLEETKVILVEVEHPATVTGQLAFEGEVIPQGVFVKLLTREITGEDPMSQVNRCVARQTQTTTSERFTFSSVKTGDMQLLAEWQEDNGTKRILVHNFAIESGESRDLGSLEFRRGLSAKILLQTVDLHDRSITLVGGSDTRYLMITPLKPNADWPYLPQYVPVGKEFVMGGLYAGEWELAETSPQEQVKDPRWLRLPAEPMRFSTRTPGLHVFKEVYAARARLNCEILLSDVEREFDLKIFAVRKGGGEVVRSRRTTVSGAAQVELRLAEGTYSVFVIGQSKKGDLVPCASQDVTMAAEEPRTITMSLQIGGTLSGTAKVASGELAQGIVASPLALAKQNVWIYNEQVQVDGRFRLAVHPGPIKIRGVVETFHVAPNERMEVGEIVIQRK